MSTHGVDAFVPFAPNARTESPPAHPRYLFWVAAALAGVSEPDSRSRPTGYTALKQRARHVGGATRRTSAIGVVRLVCVCLRVAHANPPCKRCLEHSSLSQQLAPHACSTTTDTCARLGLVCSYVALLAPAAINACECTRVRRRSTRLGGQVGRLTYYMPATVSDGRSCMHRAGHVHAHAYEAANAYPRGGSTWLCSANM